MAPRASSNLLLVGSLPAESTESALRAAGDLFGDLVFALPDGETGPRAGWVSYERERLVRPNPDIATVRETLSPTGLPRHAYETPVFKIRPGVTELHWDSWPRIDDAIDSYRVFSRLRADGAIPAGLRFQIGLPFPSSALNGFKEDFAADYPVGERAFEDLFARELTRLTAAIPPEDLALQWDVCYEVLDMEGVLAWTAPGAWERFTGPVGRLTRLIPDDVLVGYHLCYGTFPEWPMYEARDMGVLVQMANYAVANSGRAVDWLHLAGLGTCAARTTGSSSLLRTSSRATRGSSSASSCPSTASPACCGATPRRRVTWQTSASPCTAASAASLERTAWRPCATTGRPPWPRALASRTIVSRRRTAAGGSGGCTRRRCCERTSPGHRGPGRLPARPRARCRRPAGQPPSRAAVPLLPAPGPGCRAGSRWRLLAAAARATRCRRR